VGLTSNSWENKARKKITNGRGTLPIFKLFITSSIPRIVATAYRARVRRENNNNNRNKFRRFIRKRNTMYKITRATVQIVENVTRYANIR